MESKITKKDIKRTLREVIHKDTMAQLEGLKGINETLDECYNRTIKSGALEFDNRFEVKLTSKYLKINILKYRYNALSTAKDLNKFLLDKEIVYNFNFSGEESYFNIERLSINELDIFEETNYESQNFLFELLDILFMHIFE